MNQGNWIRGSERGGIFDGSVLFDLLMVSCVDKFANIDKVQEIQFGVHRKPMQQSCP